MMRIVSPIPKCNGDSKIVVINLLANTATDVVPDTRTTPDEYVEIDIFNASTNGTNLYYAFGRDCDTLENYCAWIVPGQMLTVNTRERVSMVAKGNTGIAAVTMIKLNEHISSNI